MYIFFYYLVSVYIYAYYYLLLLSLLSFLILYSYKLYVHHQQWWTWIKKQQLIHPKRLRNSKGIDEHGWKRAPFAGLVQGKVDHQKWRDSFNQRDSLKIIDPIGVLPNKNCWDSATNCQHKNWGLAASWRWGIAERTINPPRTPWPMAEVWVSSSSPFDQSWNRISLDYPLPYGHESKPWCPSWYPKK